MMRSASLTRRGRPSREATFALAGLPAKLDHDTGERRLLTIFDHTAVATSRPSLRCGRFTRFAPIVQSVSSRTPTTTV
jgi:hypothetical protein